MLELVPSEMEDLEFESVTSVTEERGDVARFRTMESLAAVGSCATTSAFTKIFGESRVSISKNLSAAFINVVIMWWGVVKEILSIEKSLGWVEKLSHFLI
jgi:hypothetical protein